ncbi:hypothetical protein FRB93_011387 [Tulasnella sp. JGI-2019a]|nr:hypothetical protein FRB93_011387 [Tulasnella sp. JGI-2019a]
MLTASQNPVLNGRPCEKRGKSIFLYHPIFRQYEEILGDNTWTPSAEEYRATETLGKIAVDFYADGSAYAAALKPALSKILEFPLASDGGDTSSDGVMTVVIHADSEPIPCLLLNLEMANESGCDPSFEVVLSYRRFCSKENYRKVWSSCRCPSFLLAVTGPWLCVMGAVFVEKVVSQPLSHFIWIGEGKNAIASLDDRTRQLCALSRSLKELKTFYETLDFNHNIDPADLALPYPTQIPNEPPFRYMIPFLDDSRKAIFKGKRSCGKSIVVKFTDRYNEKAHRILAKHGLAPQLLHIQSIGGGLTMVVMDLVRGLTLDEVTRDSISPRRIVMRCARRSNSCTKKISYLEIYDLPMFYFPTTGVRF